MTNAQIIFRQSIDLVEKGIIKGTGRMIEMVLLNDDGTEEKKMVEEPEPIHTFAVWKQLGYSVKKGEKAKASFMIWKYVQGKKKEETEEEPEDKMFMKKAHFFTFEQVEPVK